MGKHKNFLIVLWFLLFSNVLTGMSADTTSIIDNIYNYDFLKAKEQLSRFNDQNVLMSATLNLEISWWMAIESGEEKSFAGFLSSLEQFEKSEKSDLREIISSTYRMRYYACNNKNYLVPFVFIKIQNKIDNVDITKLGDNSKEGLELFILYKSFLSLIENSIIVDRLVSESKVRRELIGNIEAIIESGSSPNRTIGRYFMMKYYLDVEKDKSKAFSYLTELHNQYPKNKIFTQLLTN